MTPPDAPFPALWATAWGEDSYGYWQAFEINSVQQVMRWIPAGEFMMGSPKSEAERNNNEKQHLVTLTQGYWLADTACTQELWQTFMNENPSHFTVDDQRPVESVSWNDCQQFLAAINVQLPQGLRLRLPTEAQWEYACRAGTQTVFSFGDTISKAQANFNGNNPYNGAAKELYRSQTLTVDAFAPNPWGLIQMHGNVWEWCEDYYGSYDLNDCINPKGPTEGHRRVIRGGSYFNDARILRSASRNHRMADLRSDHIGLRLAAG